MASKRQRGEEEDPTCNEKARGAPRFFYALNVPATRHPNCLVLPLPSELIHVAKATISGRLKKLAPKLCL
jgi:hypothetical protein